MIDRRIDMALVRRALRRSPVVALLGARQCGKTTLARQLVPPNSLNYFDLEDPQTLARLDEPDTALRPLKKLVVIDEVQRRPELFPLLRVLADRRPLPARFLILGSASPDLLRQSSESLAGRLETVPLEGFRLADLGVRAMGRHWLRGGFPRSYTPRLESDRCHGDGSSCRRSWSATSRNWEFKLRPRPCAASGTCWRIITARFGTPPSWRVLSRSTKQPCAATSTS